MNTVNLPTSVEERLSRFRSQGTLGEGAERTQVDGKEAVTFLVRVKDCIENPSRLLLGI